MEVELVKNADGSVTIGKIMHTKWSIGLFF